MNVDQSMTGQGFPGKENMKTESKALIGVAYTAKELISQTRQCGQEDNCPALPGRASFRCKSKFYSDSHLIYCFFT